MEGSSGSSSLGRTIKGHLAVHAVLQLAIWIPVMANMKFGGIRPRRGESLGGILTAPLAHASPEHAAVNALMLAIITELHLWRSFVQWVYAFIFGWVVGGFFLWVVGSPHVHTGMNGVVFALLGYLLTIVFFEKPFRIVNLALFVLGGLLYFGILQGAFPKDPRVSWQDDLTGLATGLCAALIYGKMTESYANRQRRYAQFEDERNEPKGADAVMATLPNAAPQKGQARGGGSVAPAKEDSWFARNFMAGASSRSETASTTDGRVIGHSVV
ncbi:unnamed protein product [Vitrella brassicaformis CCMP3155]|uniref:Peptidase S54 rhomboid domain-containing protein n=1 Tax=Vitrella brassicaformis (strain CCMP3155) TaxID=1169540 RepID=A0A0G4FMU6_VITBC|nr:unnamed protein product [Vitrella brassicaformis CCMP3155]|eukprot:CEM15574.1 unnamed protein product [Vitrella brassicaformis CCMP3155]